MRILYLITSLDYGGTQKQLFYIVESLKKKHSTLVVSLKSNGKIKSKFDNLGVPVLSLDLPNKFSLQYLRHIPVAVIKLMIIVCKFNPDIIHSFLFQANFFSRLIKLVFPKIKIINSERVAEKEKKINIFFSKISNFLVNKLTVNSNDLKNFISKTQNVSVNKIIVINNILETKDISVDRDKLTIRKSLNITNNDFMILSIGRLQRQKNYGLLVDIAYRLKDYKDIYFVVLGDGCEYAELIEKVKRYNLLDEVKFIGYKQNVYDYINSCDLFILTSLWEGSPNVLLEAVYFRKPIISTNVCGVKEILDNYQVGYIVDIDNINQDRDTVINSFASKIKQIYEKKPIVNEEVVWSILANYSLEKIINKIIDLY